MPETCRRLRRLCRKHSNNVARHDKIQLSQHFCRATKIFCGPTLSFMSRRSCEFYTFRSCNTCAFSLTTFAELRQDIIFCCRPVYYKTLIRSMRQPDLYCFETIKMTPQAWSNFTENTRLRLVSSIQNLTRFVTSFLWFQNSIDQAVS